MKNGPELLAPAGTLRHLEYAFAFGADAVYAGMPRYSLRVRNNAFDRQTIEQGIQRAHQLEKQFFLACNLIPHGSKVNTFMQDIEPFIELKPDAMIMADPGLIMMVRDKWPQVPIHLSVQANTMNAATVKFWERMGVSRVILSRELSLDEIEEIRQACPDMELEVFVHGALCIAYSGRCLLSGYMSHRDANQGSCTNSCRWDYKVKAAGSQADSDNPDVRHSAADEPWLLEEKQRPGEEMAIYEDEAGTYIMNSKDLRAVEHIQRLVDIGVDSLKIEGRTKSIYYVTRVCQSYRGAIDDAVAGRAFDDRYIVDLEKLSNRGYTSGFYQRHNHREYQTYDTNHSRNRSQIFVGEVVAYDAKTGLAEVDVKNKIQRGDDIEVIAPGGSKHFRIEKMLDEHGHEIDVAPGSGWRIKLALPEVGVPALIARYIEEENQSVIRVTVDEPRSDIDSQAALARRPSP
ncbi:MAG: tRNA 5-hydroxyuridine modification protein YegQ [Proteobacteria bacterium]|nr:tRNA 5-hydroxyuridine modification protein YegQ [Pseudomonadota bacterium]